jgi:protein ATS1
MHRKHGIKAARLHHWNNNTKTAKTDDKMLFALGSNGSGQLGIGSTEDAHTPQKCILPPGLDAKSITSIVAGGNHTLISTPGKTYAAGDNSNGRYPVIHRYTQTSPESALSFRLSTVSSQFCAATWEASTIIDDIQRVVTCGTGQKGELGLGLDVKEMQRATVIKNFPAADENNDDEAFIADVSASMSHTVVVLTNGSVYGWGAGRKGQLGEPAEDVWTPRKITGLPLEPHRVACGKDFTFFVGAPDSNQFIILGTNDRWGVISQMPQTPLLAPWKDVGASWGSIFILLENGDLISWGRNDRGQLGPKVGLPKLAKIAVGSEHVIALTTEQKVIAWGWGEHGNCGTEVDADGDVKGETGYTEIVLPAGAGNAVGVGAGCATSFIITDASG